MFYDNDGTGRDLYIGPSGGLHNEYAFKNPRVEFVDNLRTYRVNDEQRKVYARSKRINVLSPLKDHFVEGQVSIRSPFVKNDLD